MNNDASQDPRKLSPEMASMRLLVLGFVRDYIARWQASPSYGEIGNGLGTNRTRVRKAVKSLVADGLLLRTPGPRGLALPTQREDAMRVLRALGWQVDEDRGLAHRPVTNGTLMPPAELDYISSPGRLDGDGNGGQAA